MLDGEALALMSLGFHRVYFAELHCKDHGEIRIAVETKPRHRHPCPICNRSCWCSRVLCTGYTKRETPFYERVSGPAVIRAMIKAEYIATAAANENSRRAAAIIGCVRFLPAHSSRSPSTH